MCYAIEIASIEKYKSDVLVIPGVMTAAEAVAALEAGADFAKFFDLGFRGGEKYARFLCGGPFHGLLDIFVTGGVTLKKIKPYLSAGVKMVGSGFDVVLGDNYATQQEVPSPEMITGKLREFLEEAMG